MRSLLVKIKSLLVNPYKGLLHFSEFNRIRKMQRFVPGQTEMLGNQISFSDNFGFLCSVLEIFRQEQNKFATSAENPLIIDCGSNIGLSILYFKRQYPKATILAFEPDPLIYQLLEKNIASYALSDVTAYQAAIWIEDTELEFFSDGSLAGSLELDIAKENHSFRVKALRLKSILQQKKKIDFLKIDIEGAESSVLFDIAEELSSVKTMFLEYHSISGKPQRLGEILGVISNAGFRYYMKNHNDYLVHPFNDQPRDDFDMQLSIFCFRNNA